MPEKLLSRRIGVPGGRVGDFGGMQERFGRDAAAVEAGSSNQVLFHECHGEPELVGAQCCGVSGRASSEDGDVGTGQRSVLNVLCRWSPC